MKSDEIKVGHTYRNARGRERTVFKITPGSLCFGVLYDLPDGRRFYCTLAELAAWAKEDVTADES